LLPFPLALCAFLFPAASLGAGRYSAGKDASLVFHDLSVFLGPFESDSWGRRKGFQSLGIQFLEKPLVSPGDARGNTAGPADIRRIIRVNGSSQSSVVFVVPNRGQVGLKDVSHSDEHGAAARANPPVDIEEDFLERSKTLLRE
jgi:hypothetical protein